MKLHNYQYDNPASHEAVVDAYLAKLKTFLLTPDHGDSSWPDIPRAELDDARGLIADMLQVKWGRDCDGDRPVRTLLWYRRTHRPVCDWAVLENDPPPNARDPVDALEKRLLNNLSILGSVVGAASEELRRTQVELTEMALARRQQAAAVDVYLVRYHKPDNWAGEVHDFPVSMHLTKESADAFVAEGFAVSRVYAARKALPARSDNQADNYAEFRERLTGLTGKVLGYYANLSMLFK